MGPADKLITVKRDNFNQFLTLIASDLGYFLLPPENRIFAEHNTLGSAY